MLTESKVREIVKEELASFPVKAAIAGHASSLFSQIDAHEVLINENVDLSTIRPIIKHVIQWMIAGAAEYGIIISTFGMGAVGFAEVVETIIDVLFFAGDIGYLIADLKDINRKVSNVSKEMKIIIEKCTKLFDKHPIENLDKFYANVRSITRHVFKLMGKDSEFAAHEIVGIIKNDLSKTGSLISDAMKVLIPDATIGFGLALAIHTVIIGVPQNAYSILKTGLKVVGKFMPWLLKPDAAMDFFKEAYPKIIEVFRNFEDETNNSGITGLDVLSESLIDMKRFVVPKMFGWIADLLEKKKSSFFWILDKILNFVVPNFFLNVALLQIFMKEEYASIDFDKEIKPEEKTEQDNDDESVVDNSQDYDSYPEDSAGPDAYPEDSIVTDAEPEDSEGPEARGPKSLSESRNRLRSLERDIRRIESRFIRGSR